MTRRSLLPRSSRSPGSCSRASSSSVGHLLYKCHAMLTTRTEHIIHVSRNAHHPHYTRNTCVTRSSRLPGSCSRASSSSVRHLLHNCHAVYTTRTTRATQVSCNAHHPHDKRYTCVTHSSRLPGSYSRASSSSVRHLLHKCQASYTTRTTSVTQVYAHHKPCTSVT